MLWVNFNSQRESIPDSSFSPLNKIRVYQLSNKLYRSKGTGIYKILAIVLLEGAPVIRSL